MAASRQVDRGIMDPTRIAFERRGHGRPLLLLHGLGDRRQSWRSVMRELGGEYEVVAVDLPGFGDSPGPPRDEPYDVPALVTVVREFCALHGLDRPHLAGNSLGGAIALELAAQDHASSVTVFSPAGFLPRRTRFRLYVLGALAGLAAHAPMPVKERIADSAPARAAARATMRGNPASPEARSVRFGVRSLWPGAPYVRMVPRIADYRFEHQLITCPVTVAWGDRDRTLLPSTAQHAHERLPDARRVSLIGCGHIPMADDPLTVAEQIRWTCGAADRDALPNRERHP